MPIQVSGNDFIQFMYQPSYLKDDFHLQSDPLLINGLIGLKPTYSNINLDGGNIVSCNDRAIITDRVFDKNGEYKIKVKLVSGIEELLCAEVIIIPQIKSDMTGHADRLVRFVDRNTIIGNNRSREYKSWSKGIEKVLHEYSLQFIDLPFFEFKDSKHPFNAMGCYLNYLEVINLIIIPIFEVKDNHYLEVFDLFKQIFCTGLLKSLFIMK